MATEKRLIDANALVKKLYADFDNVFHNAGEKVKPEDYYVKRRSVYEADLFKAEIDGFVGLVNALPIVDAVEVVHGRWEPHPEVNGYERCSVCHDCIIYDDWVEEPKWYYCPNCGAKMDGGART